MGVSDETPAGSAVDKFEDESPQPGLAEVASGKPTAHLPSLAAIGLMLAGIAAVLFLSGRDEGVDPADRTDVLTRTNVVATSEPALTLASEPSPTATPEPQPTTTPSPRADGILHVEADGAGEYPTIFAALSAAQDGDEIRLGPGEHASWDALVLDKDVDLIGSGESTRLSVINPDNVLRVTGATTSIRQMSFMPGFDDSDDDAYAVVLVRDSEVQLIDVTVESGEAWGLVAIDSGGSVTSSRFADNREVGAYFGGDSRIDLSANVADGNGIGLVWTGTAGGIATANEIANNNRGIEVAESASPELFDNQISGNDELGIGWFGESSGEAGGNSFASNGLDTYVDEFATPTFEDDARTTVPSEPTPIPSATPLPTAAPTRTAALAPATRACPDGWSGPAGGLCTVVLLASQANSPAGVVLSCPGMPGFTRAQMPRPDTNGYCTYQIRVG